MRYLFLLSVDEMIADIYITRSRRICKTGLSAGVDAPDDVSLFLLQYL